MTYSLETRAILAMTRRANDRAAASIPTALINTSWQDGNANGEMYRYKVNGSYPDKLILFLHSWSSDKTQAENLKDAGTAATPWFNSWSRCVIVSPNFNGPNGPTGGPNTMYSPDALARIRCVISEMRWKTGLDRVYLMGFSGGGTAALKFLGTYPGIVHRASIWYPANDLQQYFGECPASGGTNPTQADFLSAIGHPPIGSNDPDYAVRSPSSTNGNIIGPVDIFLNARSDDAVIPVHHSRDARDQITGIGQDVALHYCETTGGHTFGANEMLTSMRQLILD